MSGVQPFRLKRARQKVKVTTRVRQQSSQPPESTSANQYSPNPDIVPVRHFHSAPLINSTPSTANHPNPHSPPHASYSSSYSNYYSTSDASETESIEEGRQPKTHHKHAPPQKKNKKKPSGALDFFGSFFARSPHRTSSGSYSIKETVTSPRLQPLQLHVRAKYRPEPRYAFGRPLPLLTIWALALCFVCVIMIPDLNNKLTSIPVLSARSLLTSEEPVGKTAQVPAGSTSRKLGGATKSESADVASGNRGEAVETQTSSKLKEKEKTVGEAVKTKKQSKDGQAQAQAQAQVDVKGAEEEVFWFDPASDGGSSDGILSNSQEIGDWATTSQEASGKDTATQDASSSQEDEAESELNSNSNSNSNSLHWPNKLVLALAVGYGVENVSTLVRTFQRFIGGARMVLFVDQPIRGWEPSKGVVIQPFHKPQVGLWSRLPLWLVRFRLYKLFLETVQGKGAYKRHSTVIFCDARDVAFLGDPFPLFRNESSVYLFQESTSFPDTKAKKLSNNHKWISACYGSKAAFSLAGKRVVNAGFMAGSFQAMSKLAGAVAGEAERLPEETCTSKWGSDQAILNYLIRSEAIAQVVPFILEDNEHGAVMQRFSKRAVVRITPQEENEEAEPVVRNKDGRPILAIHGYDRFSDTHEVVKQLM